MSIYGTRFVYGDDEGGRGEVLSYTGSHLYPDLARDGEAHLLLCEIPPWCVPGHQDDMDDHEGRTGEYLRLTLSTLHHAAADKWGRPMSPDGATVTLTREAARRIAAELTAWADAPEVTRRRPSSARRRAGRTVP